jgi:hypothetical protein
MSIARYGENNPMYGIKHTKDTRVKISNSLKGSLTAFDKVKGINIRVTTEEFSNDNNLVGLNKGKKKGIVIAYDKDKGINRHITKEEFNKDKNLVGLTKGMVTAFDSVKKTKVRVTTEQFHEDDNLVSLTKGRKQPIVKCPHCDKRGGISLMKRYHFDNCRIRNN